MADERQGGTLGWFVAGLGLGALIGVLYAPKSGRETREDLAAGAREGTEYIRARSKEAAEQMGTYVDRGKSQVNEYIDRGKSYANRGRSHWDEFVSKGKDFVSQQGDKVSAAVEAGRKAYRSTTDERTY
jgi:gas vesicle protein